MGSLGRAKEASGSFGGECVHSGAHCGRRVHSVSRGCTRPRLVNVAFIRVRVGSLRLAEEWSCSLEFARVHSEVPSCCRVHSGSRGFTTARSFGCGSMGRRVNFGSPWLARTRLGVVVFIWGGVGSLGRA